MALPPRRPPQAKVHKKMGFSRLSDNAGFGKPGPALRRHCRGRARRCALAGHLTRRPGQLRVARNAVFVPVPSALPRRRMNDLLLFFIFFRFSAAPSASWAHSTLNHSETLKPSDRCGQQFWPSSGKWTGATCHADSSCWGKVSPPASFLLRDTCARLSNPMALLLRIPGLPCGETPLLDCGVCTKGNVRYCEGLTVASLSTIFRMPRRRIS